MMQTWKDYAGTEGSIYYYYGFPRNAMNDWLVAEHQKRFGAPPDFFVAGGMIAAAAVVEALKKTNGDADAEKLISAMEGMSFDSVKGKITIRKEDHQAHAGDVCVPDQERRQGLRSSRSGAYHLRRRIEDSDS